MGKKPKTSRFAGRVKDNAQKTKSTGANYGYLTLPKGVSVFSPEPGGKCLLDFMPYVVTTNKHPDGIEPGEWWYKRPFKAHRNIGIAKESVVCLTSIGKKCPICEYRAEMIKEGRDKADTDALKPSQRNLYVVIPKGSKKHEEKPHVFDISAAMFQNLLAEELEENDKYEVFPDLEQGYTLKIRFDSRTIGSGKPFAEASRIDFEERDPYDESIMDEIPDLDSMLNIMSYQVLEKKFLEMDDAGEAEEEPSKPTRGTSRKPEPEPEEEETPPPPSRPKRTAPKPPPEPEEEEEENVCIACEGTGKNSKGYECKICGGTGEAKVTEVPTVTKKPEVKRDAKKNRCPFEHVFGIDCEKYDHCDDCDKWDECIEEKEKKK